MVENPERYRIYRRAPDKQLYLVASCADPEAVWVALVTLGVEGEFDGCTVGILDRPDPGQTGTWILSPFGASGV